MGVSRSIIRALAAAMLWTVCALVSVTYARESGGMAMVWPAGAILTATLLVERHDRRWMAVLAVIVASLLISMLPGYTLLTTLGITIARVGESILAAWLVTRFLDVEELFDRPIYIFRFTFAAIAACIPSAVFTGGLLHILHGRIWLRTTLDWLPSHICGLLILTPILLIVRQTVVNSRIGEFSGAQALRTVAILGPVAGITTLVFMQASYGLSFLIVPALLVATFYLRAPGAAASVLIIAMIGSYCLISGRGPLVLIPVSVTQRAFLMELFIATMFLCALPLAAVLNQRDRLAQEAARHMSNLRSVADRVVEVLFRVDDRGRWAYLSPFYETLTGRSIDEALGRRVLAEIPRADHPRLLDKFHRLSSGEIDDVIFATTTVDTEGNVRDIEATMFRVLSEAPDRFSLGGILRDVTTQRQLEAQLEERARAAQLAAEASERAARTDELTGLPNRRALFERLAERFEDDNPLTLAIFDIDHFKRINDSYGHPAGDEVLRRIAAITSARLDARSMIARIGGEEFAVLIDGMMPASAFMFAKGMVEAVAAAPIILIGDATDNREEAIIPVTISMGLVARYTGSDSTELFATADRALYAAKNGGRNQLQLAA